MGTWPPLHYACFCAGRSLLVSLSHNSLGPGWNALLAGPSIACVIYPTARSSFLHGASGQAGTVACWPCWFPSLSFSQSASGARLLAAERYSPDSWPGLCLETLCLLEGHCARAHPCSSMRRAIDLSPSGRLFVAFAGVHSHVILSYIS